MDRSHNEAHEAFPEGGDGEVSGMPDDLDRQTRRRRWIALLLLTLGYALSITDRLILSVLFEPIKAEFHLSDAQLGLLGGFAFALFYALVGIPIAQCADRRPRLPIIVFSMVFFSLATALCGLATSFGFLIVTRMLVGVGEAGTNPAAQSILGDYFSTERRAMAMSVMTLGGSVGTILGFLVGGYASQHYGWRSAFLFVGMPGVILAAIVFFFLKEPARGLSDKRSAPPTVPALSEAIAYLWQNKAMRHLLAGSTASAILSYGMVQWLPAFFMRTHHLPQAKVGVLLSGLFGVLGVLGTLVSGYVFDRLMRVRPAYAIWMVAACQVAVVPLSVMAFLAPQLRTALLLFALPVFISNFYLGPSLGLVQSLAPLNMRTVGAALKMLLLNLIGLGVGPLLIGWMSDVLQPRFGDASLQVALALSALISIWSAAHFWLCGRNLEEGLAMTVRHERNCTQLKY